MRTLNLIIRYNLRSVILRRASTGAIFLSVGIVIGVFCYLLTLADGLRRTLTVAADPFNVIVLAQEATAESNSALPDDAFALLAALPQVATAPDGRPLTSPEVAVQTNVLRRGDRSGTFAGLALRGVDLSVALAVHPSIHLVNGRWFRPGSDELVVGKAANLEFQNLSIGSHIECGSRTFEIVGVFRADGGSHESELWGHLSNVSAAYRREMYSSAVVRLKTTDNLASRQAISRIGSSAVALKGIREDRYYADQLQNARIVERMALAIVGIMAIGAVFAAMNAFDSSLTSRIREFGMLRSVGFSNSEILAGVLAEATTIAVAGGMMGCMAAGATIWLSGATRDLVGTSTFTSVAFTMQIRSHQIVRSLLVAVLIGLVGAARPAWRAVRECVVSSLRAV
jgi:putative ABC transport system permease protein